MLWRKLFFDVVGVSKCRQGKSVFSLFNGSRLEMEASLSHSMNESLRWNIETSFVYKYKCVCVRSNIIDNNIIIVATLLQTEPATTLGLSPSRRDETR